MEKLTTIAYPTKEARNSEYQRLKRDGYTKLHKYTTHLDNKPAIVWVLAYEDRPELAFISHPDL